MPTAGHPVSKGAGAFPMGAPAPSPLPGFLFLVCPDSRLLRARADEAAAAFAGGEPVDRHCYWGDEPPSQAFRDNLTMAGLLGTRRFILVRKANCWQAAAWHALDRLLARPRKNTLVAFCLENEWKKEKWNEPLRPSLPPFMAKLSCWRFAEKKGWIWKDEGLTDANMATHIARMADERHLRLSGQAIRRLAESLPRSGDVVENELDKLALLPQAREGEIGSECIATADWVPDANLFACVDALMARNAGKLWEQVALVRDKDSAVFLLLGILASNLRLLWKDQAGELVAFRGLSRKTLPALGDRLGKKGICEAMGVLVDAERGIKSGLVTPAQAFDSLLARLLDIFTRTPTPSAGR